MSDPKRIIHELSEDDLVALALGSAKKENLIQKVSKAAKFILHNKIKHGSTKISALMVYYTYQKWQDGIQDSKRKFFKDFNEYFPPYRNKDGIYYLLDEKGFDLSAENYWKMRAAWRKNGKKQ